MDISFLDGKILLNSGRNCLAYIVRSCQIRKIHIPYYICPIVWQILRRENVEIKFYHIDKDFLPICDFKSDDYILYPDYFGICGYQSGLLASKYKNLILDNSHAFYAPKKGLAAFYSPRKFFNVNDGGILDCNSNLIDDFPVDKARTIKIKGFDSFCKNELSIDNQPIKFMSFATKRKLLNINFEEKKVKRRKIFDEIDKKLCEINNFNFSVSKYDIPMIYPIISSNNDKIADLLSKNGIYTIKYWSNLPSHFPEAYYQNNILAIPLLDKSFEIIEMI